MPPGYRPNFFAKLVAYQTTQLQQAMGYSKEVAHDLAYNQIQGVQHDDAGLPHRHLVAAKWKKNIIGGAWYVAVPERATSLLWILIEDGYQGQGHGCWRMWRSRPVPPGLRAWCYTYSRRTSWPLPCTRSWGFPMLGRKCSSPCEGFRAKKPGFQSFCPSAASSGARCPAYDSHLPWPNGSYSQFINCNISLMPLSGSAMMSS